MGCRKATRVIFRGHYPEDTHENGKVVPVVTEDGTLYRVRVWDAVLKKQIERTAEGLDAAKQLLEEFNEAKRRPGHLQAERVRFTEVAARYLVAYGPSATALRVPSRRWPKSGRA